MPEIFQAVKKAIATLNHKTKLIDPLGSSKQDRIIFMQKDKLHCFYESTA